MNNPLSALRRPPSRPRVEPEPQRPYIREAPDLADQIESDMSASDIEGQIGGLIQDEVVRPAAPLPGYVQHNPEANQIARMTAQVLAAQYEETARQIEATAQSLIEMAARCDADTMQVVRENEEVRAKITVAVSDCAKTAQAYREKAAAVFKDVQDASILAEEVRSTCAELQHRVMTGEPKAVTDSD